MRRALLAGATLTLIGGCVAEPPADGGSVGGRMEWIVDGTRVDGGEEAVVVVYNRGGGLCTGALVTPQVVLTAKHCVQRPGASEPSAPGSFAIGVGDHVRRISQQYGVREVYATPGSYRSSSRGLTGDLVGQDVGLLTLTRGAPVDPLPLWRGPPGDLVGETLKAVGFGETPDGQVGIKYRATTAVEGIRGGVIYTPPTICKGDSGGPLISPEGEVFGVASFGLRGSCGSGVNGYNRIDTFMEMIDEAIGEAGDCLDDGEEVCDGFDNDCNGEADEICNEVGEPCETVEDCVGGERGGLLCSDTPAGRICTRDCDPLRPFQGCPSEMYCAGRDGCDGHCVPGTPGEKGYDEPCERDSECASLFCADPGDGARRCLTPCEGDAGACFAGEVCAAAPGNCGSCVAADIVHGRRSLGEPCGADDDCRAERCFREEGVSASASYCTRECSSDDDCGERFHCRSAVMDEAGTEADVCVFGDRPGIGASCIRNGDCHEGGFCAEREGSRWCTEFCEGDGDCPPNYTCVEAGEQKVCAPERAVPGEECSEAGDCVSGLCVPAGERSLCTVRCGPHSPCDPGFRCHRAAEGEAVCLPAPAAGGSEESTGGCSVTRYATRTEAAALLCIAACTAFALRRRRK